MSNIPWWKLTRELRRLGQQLRAAPNDLGTFFFGALYYDNILAKYKRVYHGQIPSSSRVAIYLIYPERGFLASHRRSLEYLNSRGLSVIVVSNLPLPEQGREEVLPLCTTYIERPNFGYDFGGYRDGVLTIAHRLSELDQLVLVNDSSWFPLPGAKDWIAQVDALNVDFSAAASNFGIPRIPQDRFREIHWTYSTDHINFHYCSYALALSAKILRDPYFLRYWQQFPLSNKKKRTVRRGEIGLSQWVIRRGYTHCSTLDIAGLDKVLKGLSDARLVKAARAVAIPEDWRLHQVKYALLNGPDATKREALIPFILTAVARQGASYAIPDISIHEQGFPFLKKSPVWLNEEASDITLRIAKEFDDSAGAEIFNEALQLRLARAPKFRQWQEGDQA